MSDIIIDDTTQSSTTQDFDDEPKETIYINNLNDKVSISKLKSSLESLFNKYGTILQITAHNNIKMKGQAFITFDNIESSKSAVDGLQNYELFKKPIHIKFARSNSDEFYSKVLKDDESVNKRKAHKVSIQSNRDEEFKRKIELVVNKSSVKKITKSFKDLPPNKILILQKIDQKDITNDDIITFFSKFDGFINSRFVKVRNLSFIEFETTNDSTKCLDTLTKQNPQSLSTTFGSTTLLTFAKK